MIDMLGRKGTLRILFHFCTSGNSPSNSLIVLLVAVAVLISVNPPKKRGVKLLLGTGQFQSKVFS